MKLRILLAQLLCLSFSSNIITPAASAEKEYAQDPDVYMVVWIGEKSGNQKIILKKGNLLDQPVQAIVNAANRELSGGGGVTGAIWNSLGSGWQEHVNSKTYSRQFSPTPLGIKPGNKQEVLNTGFAAITTLVDAKNKRHKNLKGKEFFVTKPDGATNTSIIAVIHAVGPKGTDKERAALIRQAYVYSLIEADHAKLNSIAFPTISSEIYGYSVTESAPEVLDAVLNYFTSSSAPRFGSMVPARSVKTIYFIFFDNAVGTQGLTAYTDYLRRAAQTFSDTIHIIYDKELPTLNVKQELTQLSYDLTHLTQRVHP